MWPETLNEDIPVFEMREIWDMVRAISNEKFKGKDVKAMNTDEKYRLSVDAIASVTYLTPSILNQVLRSKDYGVKGFASPVSPKQ